MLARLLLLFTVLCANFAANAQPRAADPQLQVPWQEGFAQSSDGNVFFATLGKGPAIVLIAGGPGASSWSLRHSFAALASHFTLIAIDNIGRGRSDSLAETKQHSIARDAKDIEAVRKHLKQDRIAVYGHSYGGLVATQYALDFGTKVSHLMLGNTAHGAHAWQQQIDDSNYMVQQLYPEIWEKLLALRAQGIKSSDPRYIEIFDQAEGDVYVHDLIHPPPPVPKSPHNADREINKKVYQSFLGDDPEWRVGGSLAGVELLPRFAELAMPVLIVSGRFDRVAQPRFAYAMYAALKNAPKELAMFENSAHRPMREEPELFQVRLKTFLSKP